MFETSTIEVPEREDVIKHIHFMCCAWFVEGFHYYICECGFAFLGEVDSLFAAS